VARAKGKSARRMWASSVLSGCVRTFYPKREEVVWTLNRATIAFGSTSPRKIRILQGTGTREVVLSGDDAFALFDLGRSPSR